MILDVAHHFDSARRKVARAREHIPTLEREVAAFFAAGPYIRVAELTRNSPALKFISSDLLKIFRTSLPRWRPMHSTT
jgi:hypothetical protein